MKLYRVVNDPFTYRGGLINPKIEALLYKGGYTLLYDSKKDFSGVSNLFRFKEDSSKYFFVNPEDAVCYADRFTLSYICHILEYEFDDDKLPRLFGFGDYCEYAQYDDCRSQFYLCLESLVNPYEFTGEKIKFNDLTDDEKYEMILSLEKDVVNVTNYFRKVLGVETIEPSTIEEVKNGGFSNYEHIRAFLKEQDFELIKSKEITGRVFSMMFNIGTMDKWDVYKHSIEYMKDCGLYLDRSDEAKKEREKILQEIGYSIKGEPDKYFENVKKRINEYNSRKIK